MANNKKNNSESGSDYYDEDEYETQAPVSFGQKSAFIVDKVLGRKFIKVSSSKAASTSDESSYEELFLIKWRGMSYLHASWEKREDIERFDPQGKIKLKRFLIAPHLPGILGEGSAQSESAQGKDGEDDDEDIDYFNPDLVEVQRIISCDTLTCWHKTAKTHNDLLKPPVQSERSSKKAKVIYKDEEEEWDANADLDRRDSQVSSSSSLNYADSEVKYYVKWRGLPYNECSWERWADIKTASYQVWKFWKIQKPPPLPVRKNRFPTLQEYQRLTKSPVFGMDDSGNEDSGEGLRLRDYQLEGVNWLLWNWWHKRPCVLADEMGLGKTIQTIGFLHQLRHMRSTRVDGPFLIIAPLSLLNQWQSEIATWAPDMNCVMLHGSAEARELVVNNEFYFQEPYCSRADANALQKANTYKFHVLLTTFEMATKDIRVLAKIQWQVMIVDEAHKLKNQQSRLFQSLTQIPREYCVLLTGTPLQNRTEELWALLNFADPNRFNNVQEFLENFGDLKEAAQVAKLHNILKPYLLRRIKEDVEKSLPPKEETIVEVALTSIQKKYYRAIYEKNTSFLFKGVKASNQPSLMNVMMELRKCCNHPYLVKGVEDRVAAELTPEELRVPNVIQQKFIESSGKLVLLDKLLPKLYAQGHKVLIFSQMVRVLNIIEDFLKYRGYTFERLDGSTPSNDRKDAVERFCRLSMNRFIMLLSTKAGGLGLNLTAADTVIIFDSDWNPQNDLQAQARAHRIGQTKAVMVYRLLTRKTYEMEMFHQASMKLGLDRAVLAHARNEGSEGAADDSLAAKAGGGVGKTQLSVNEIDELLKRGAYDVFREDDTEQNEFVEADIDAILQRRAHKVVYEKNGTIGGSSLGSFSKASFVSKDEKEDVDINDPDFWQKAVGLNKEVTGALDDGGLETYLPMQRIRKQTKSYNETEAALNEFLRPLNSKASKDKKREDQPPKTSKESREQEKIQKEALKQLKAEMDSKVKSDPNNWGAHFRDRVLRALTMFGFGRWDRIKIESKCQNSDAKQIESFCRAFILQCGLSASEQETTRQDSEFVREAISAAIAVSASAQAGLSKLEIPPSITEEKFVTKLRQGQAKKTLNKMDALAKLHHCMLKVADEVLKERNMDEDVTEVEGKDVDALIAMLSIEDITDHLQLTTLRPTWAVLRPWWDILCDKHLIIGIFKHGYGRLDLIKDDPTLIFESKLKQALKEAEGTEDDSSKLLKMSGAEIQQNMEVDCQDQENFEDEMGNKQTSNATSSIMPDARLLNKLFVWLIGTTSNSGAGVGEQPLIGVDYEHHHLQGQPVESPEDASGQQTFGVENSFPIDLVVLSKAELEYEENVLFPNINEILDIESINLVYKVSVLGIKRCENLLMIRSKSSENSDHLVKNTQATTSDNSQMTSTANVDSTSCMNFSAMDSFRLSAALITFGAPISALKGGSIPSNIVEYLGIPYTSSEPGASSVYHSIDWEDVIFYAKIDQTVELVTSFYETIWLPFCSDISSKKALSNSQHKLIIPNPLLAVADHTFASRGLCHLFLLRQRIRICTQFVLQNAFSQLLDYLKSPYGRGVEYMPVWWCPWIHDVGILLAIVKYGYLNKLSLQLIVDDPQLPFNKEYLNSFVTKVFTGIVPFGLDSNSIYGDSQQCMNSFSQSALQQFPDYRELEVRVMRILEDMGRLLNLPPRSPAMFCSYGLFHGHPIFNTVSPIKNQADENAAGDWSCSKLLDFGLKHSIPPSLLPKVISRVTIGEKFLFHHQLSSSLLKFPAVPLGQYLREKEVRSLGKRKRVTNQSKL